jgi:hypothetical protein
VEWSRSIADEGGVRRFEVLIPRPRRPGLISEIESRCARIGVGCELGTRGQGSRTGRLLILTVPAEADHLCTASGARCEVQTRRERLIRMTVVTVSGPGAVVERTEAQLLDWRRQFPSGG